MHQTRRPRRLSPTRRALLGVGVSTLALSLALSIAPAWAKNGNAPSDNGGGAPGTVKLRDATTSDLVPETANDPHVCAFSIVFEYNPPTAGTWQILSWPPTGDGTQVSSGSWDSTASGTDETDVLTLGAGHYRLEYHATDASNSRNKTFWVADGCEGSSGGSGGGEQPGDTGDQGDQGQDQQGDTGSGEQPGDTGDQGDQGQDQQGDTGDPGDQGQDQQGDTGSGEQPGDTGDQGDQGQDQQGDTGGGEQPGDTGDQGDQTGEGGVQGATGGDQNGSGGSQPGDQSGNGGSQSTDDQPSAQPGNGDGGTQGVNAPTRGEGPTLPNTATTPASVLSPLLAALGLLLVIAAHPFIRRSALADRA